ncbi:MAG: hypothetical protein EAZ47_06075 [Bacteroidetes bacterium]|nr:MAG: hypothetical protein EAY72_04580 [Bacteroidota bacterium]TAF93624.1 MAG: hypothetical protein EAZ47_06075 [Bacteroidota bacterium]
MENWITIIIATILLYYLAKFLLPEYSLIPGFVFLLPLGYRIFQSIQDAQFEKKLGKLIVK